jgi:hypothetical protein
VKEYIIISKSHLFYTYTSVQPTGRANQTNPTPLAWPASPDGPAIANQTITPDRARRTTAHLRKKLSSYRQISGDEFSKALGDDANQVRSMLSPLIAMDEKPVHPFKSLPSRPTDELDSSEALSDDERILDPDLGVDSRPIGKSESPQQMVMQHVCRQTQTLFDAYIFVDWSASSRPNSGEDSIWIGAGAYDANGNLVVDQPQNPSTRTSAETYVLDLLQAHVREHRRVLIGFDFPYGYPANWHKAVGHNTGSWSTLWDLFAQRITDVAQNNNRWDVANSLNAAIAGFTGPYWGKPSNVDAPYLSETKPSCFTNDVMEFRQIEHCLRRAGKQPKSVWQLYYNGSVGSQALLGIPVLHRLRNHETLSSCSQVWPFETGWQCPVDQQPFILHAEIWPGAIPVNGALHPVKDAAQVLSYVYWAARLDVVGNLSARFNPHTTPPSSTVQQCEGWILGL